MEGTMMPIYREGYTNPWGREFRDPFGSFGAMTPYTGYGGFGMPPAGRIFNDVQRMFDEIMPFERPSSWRLQGLDPSALAPRTDDKSWQVDVDAKDYKPNEITVKTVHREGHDFLVVEGKHETRDKDGYHSIHHFKRQYMLPANVDPAKLASKLDAKGQLIINAPKEAKAITYDRTVPMEQAPRK